VARAGQRVVIFSLEMKWQEILSRLVWLSSQINSGRYWRREMTDADWQKIATSTAEMQSQNIDIVDDASITLPQIHAVCSREQFRRPIDLVIVDYAQLVQSGSRSDNREQEVRTVSQGMKRLASAIGAPVVMLSQMNDDGRLRESRTLYHDASHVWILKKAECQDGIDKEDGIKRYELEIAKGRNSADDAKISMLYFSEQTRLAEETFLVEDAGRF
jgi:replicative DNA helicase